MVLVHMNLRLGWMWPAYFTGQENNLKKLKEITEMMLELMTVHLLNAAYDRVMCLF